MVTAAVIFQQPGPQTAPAFAREGPARRPRAGLISKWIIVEGRIQYCLFSHDEVHASVRATAQEAPGEEYARTQSGLYSANKSANQQFRGK